MNTRTQKATGAYYTRSDVAAYLAQATILPWVLDAAATACPAWLGPVGSGWQLLRAQPDRYLPEPLRSAGECLLPTETPGEQAARRRRAHSLRWRLRAGAVNTVNALVTYNLDLRRLLRDLVQTCRPDEAATLYAAAQRVQVLDPTSGDGAFLLAALAVLEEVHLACRRRLRLDCCPQAIRTWIVTHNLFGIDLCAATVEVCRHRLRDMLGESPQAEAAPDLTAVIRQGNVLIDTITPTEGFDVIVGNPPYLPARRVNYSVPPLTTARCPDVYAWVLERAVQWLRPGGRCGMVVPLSLGFSNDFAACRRLLLTSYRTNWFASFGRIPSALFDFDVRVRNIIHIGHKGSGPERVNLPPSCSLSQVPAPQPPPSSECFTTRLHRWFDEARPQLFDLLHYVRFEPQWWQGRIPKLNSERLGRALENCLARTAARLGDSLVTGPTPHALHFKKTAYNWLTFCRHLPPCYDASGRCIEQTQFDTIYFAHAWQRDVALLFLNGKWAYAFWGIVGDDFHVARWMFADFPLDLARLPVSLRRKLIPLARRLESVMQRATTFKRNAGKWVGTYSLAHCRSMTDRSDALFGKVLGLTKVWPDVELLYTQLVKTAIAPH